MSGQTFFFSVLSVWVGFDIYLFLFHNRKVSEKLQEKRSKFVMLAFVLVGMFGAVIVDGKSKEVFLQPFLWYRFMGVGMMIFAVVVRTMVVREIGRAHV